MPSADDTGHVVAALVGRWLCLVCVADATGLRLDDIPALIEEIAQVVRVEARTQGEACGVCKTRREPTYGVSARAKQP